jgi:peroxiredoxin
MREERRQEILGRGERMPELTLPSAAGEAPVALRAPGRRAPVVVQVHGARCSTCAACLQQLAAAEDEIAEWDGRGVVVVPGAACEAARMRTELALPFPVLADPEHRLGARLGSDGAAVLVADQWGALHLSRRVGPEHAFPAVSEIVDWLRYLAVQCPECEGEAL